MDLSILFLLQPNDFRNDDHVDVVAVATDNLVYVLFSLWTAMIYLRHGQCSYNYELC